MLKLTPSLIEQLDKLYPSPAILASKVYNIIQASDVIGDEVKVTNEDLQAFCVEYLASQAQTGELGYMMDEIKAVNKMFYLAHYDRICYRMKTPPGTGLNLAIEQESDGNQDSTIKDG